MARKLTGEVAIVTGAGSGIGAATAVELAQRGARVVLAARRQAELEAQVYTIKQTGGEATAIPTDVTDGAQVEHMVRRTLDIYGHVDVLVNNAGIGARQPMVQAPPEDIAQIVNVNLLGAMLVSRAVLPGMVERHHGAIISVASVAGLVAVDPLYSATKFGLRGFALALRRQLKGSGVSVSLVSPGFIRTPLTSSMRAQLPGPEIVAKAIADLVGHPRREVVVPRYYWGAVLAERLFPWLVDRVTSGRL